MIDCPACGGKCEANARSRDYTCLMCGRTFVLRRDAEGTIRVYDRTELPELEPLRVEAASREERLMHTPGPKPGSHWGSEVYFS